MSSFLVIALLKEENTDQNQREKKIFSFPVLAFFKRKIESFCSIFKVVKEDYLLKNPRMYREEITIVGYTGTRILISDKKNNTEEVIKELIEEERVEYIVAEKGMEKYVDSEIIIDGKFLMYLWIKEIIRISGKLWNIPKQKMKLLIIDSKEVGTKGLLDEIKEDLNYLTIATDRPEYFKEYIGDLYEEYGLMASVIKKPVVGLAEGNIVINLDSCQGKNCRYIEKNAIYIDLSNTKGRESNILSRRKDVTYYNHIELWEKDKIVDNAVLQAALCGETTKKCKKDLEEWMKRKDIISFILKSEIIKPGKITCRY